MTVLTLADADARQRAQDFTGHIALWDPKGPIRLIRHADDVSLWARTSFGVWTEQRITAGLDRPQATVYATDLVTALVLSPTLVIDAGTDAPDEWQGRMPPFQGWISVQSVGPAQLEEFVLRAARQAQEASDAELTALDGLSKKATAPLDLLDKAIFFASAATGLREAGRHRGTADHSREVAITMRLLLGLSAIGFVATDGDHPASIQATASWTRIDTNVGSVFRHGSGLPAVAS